MTIEMQHDTLNIMNYLKTIIITAGLEIMPNQNKGKYITDKD
ncbi:hypothetical protein [Clostridium estertheticum]|nr:hypothetical protein [Clostridium estertheticum]